MKVLSIFAASAERDRNSRFTGVGEGEDQSEDDEADKLPVAAPPVPKQPVYTEDGEELDPEAEEERQYLEEVHR